MKWWTQFLGEIPCHMIYVLLLLLCHAASQVRNWHHLMPHHATLKNAYRDRTSRQDAAAQRDGSDEDDGNEGLATHKVPQSFTFMPREGRVNVMGNMVFCIMTA